MDNLPRHERIITFCGDVSSNKRNVPDTQNRVSQVERPCDSCAISECT